MEFNKIISIIGKFFRKLLNMITLKEDYEDVKEMTIKKFHQSFLKAINYINSANSQHYLKGSITNIQIGDEDISFYFLHHRIFLVYDVQMQTPTKIVAFKSIKDPNNYPNLKLVPLTQLNFQINTTKNQNGFRDYQYKEKSYCMGNDPTGFLNSFLEALQYEFFPII